jgi:hypothetical protein
VTRPAIWCASTSRPPHGHDAADEDTPSHRPTPSRPRSKVASSRTNPIRTRPGCSVQFSLPQSPQLRACADWCESTRLRRVLGGNRHRLRDHRSSLRSVITGVPVPAIPSWLLVPLWDQFATLLPPRPVYAPSHPPGCHRRRISDRIIFESWSRCCGSAARLSRSPTAPARPPRSGSAATNGSRPGSLPGSSRSRWMPMTASSAWSWKRSSLTAASLKRPGEASAPAAARWTAASRACDPA